MNLESTVKFHSPKSPQFTDASRATASELLTGTDVMAALGMVQRRAQLGFSAFSGKMNLSEQDKRKAVQLLMQYGLKHCGRVAALRKLETNVRGKIVQTLATFAFQDYCRSAASHTQCQCCKGKGVIRKKESVIKHPGCGEKTPAKTATETTETLCSKCHGAGVISTACIKCRGRGVALNREKTQLQGVPVYSDCEQCSGRGYTRIPSTNAFRAISHLSGSMTIDNWKRGVKQFYEELITHIEIEENRANIVLSKVTSKD